MSKISFNKQIIEGGRINSANHPSFIPSEACVIHGVDFELVNQLFDITVEAESDAVKFQTFRSEHLMWSTVEKGQCARKITSNSESQFEMIKKLEVSQVQNLKLMDGWERNKIVFLTSPFDEVSLDELNLPAYKIASTDFTNLSFLKKDAQENKPIFASSGMTFLTEVKNFKNISLEHFI